MQGFDFGFERGRMHQNQGKMVRGSGYQKLDKVQGNIFASRNYDSCYFHFGAVKERLALRSCCQRDYLVVHGGKRHVPKLRPLKDNKLWLRRFQSRVRKDSIESDHTSSMMETEDGLDEMRTAYVRHCHHFSLIATDMVENICIEA